MTRTRFFVVEDGFGTRFIKKARPLGFMNEKEADNLVSSLKKDGIDAFKVYINR